MVHALPSVCDVKNVNRRKFPGRYEVPPYWSLGFHLCRYGYNELETMQGTVDRMREDDIPQDSQWADIDVMDVSLDFTIDEERHVFLLQIFL